MYFLSDFDNFFLIEEKSFWQKAQSFLPNFGSQINGRFKNSFSGKKFDFEVDLERDGSFFITLPQFEVRESEEANLRIDLKIESLLNLNLDRSSFEGITIDYALVEKVEEGK